MLRFILELLIMVSLGLILYLVARALPRMNDIDTTVPHPIPAPHWMTAYLERLDEQFLATAEKFLRRLRLWILKIDSKLTARLERFRKSGSNGHQNEYPLFPSGVDERGPGDTGGSGTHDDAA